MVTVLKKAGIPVLLGAVSLLTFKFMMWNSWKVDRAFEMADLISHSGSAVNLELIKNNETLLNRSFAHDPERRYYIVNNFDITPYLSPADSLSFLTRMNGKTLSQYALYQFKRFHVLDVQGASFVFTPEGISIGDFVKLRESLPRVMDSLYAAVLDRESIPEEDENLHRISPGQPFTLAYGSGRVTAGLPMSLETGRVYEIRFRYRYSGPTDANVSVLLGVPPYAGKNLLFRYPVAVRTSAASGMLPDGFREGRVLFRSPNQMERPELHLVMRKRHNAGAFKGTCRFNEITFRRYPLQTRWPGINGNSKMAYSNQIAEVKKQLTGVSTYSGFKAIHTNNTK